MEKLLIVERFEEGFAVCEGESGELLRLPRDWLPATLREGDCLRETAAGYAVDIRETEARRNRNRTLFTRLIKPKDKG